MNSFIKTPVRKELTPGQSLYMAALAMLLSPFYLMAARLLGGPGLKTHLLCVAKGIGLLAKQPCKKHARWVYYPLDSTRYIEIDFVCRHAGRFEEWLDVSSPRQIAAILLPRNPRSHATLLNPDAADLAETETMAKLLGFHCATINATADSFRPDAQFDLITCVSVLEHIHADLDTVKKLWQMLRPKGRLILTMPAYADGGIQLIDQDPYGVQPPVKEGFFFQRFYSEPALTEIRRITGEPVAEEVWGESQPGWLQANFERKRRDPLNPVWRESYDMAKNWRRFDRVDRLPGEGVYCAVFMKQPA